MAFGALAGLVMYAQQLAAFYLAPLGLVGALSRQGRIVRGTALGAGAALVIYAPWLVNLPGQLEKVGSYYWIPTPNAARFLLTLRTFMSVGIDLPMPAALYALAGALFVLIFLGMQVARTLRQGRRTDRPALLFVLWMSAAPVALMWLVSQARPVYLERALLPSALMLYLALGWLFARGGLLRPVAGVVVVVGLALAALGLNAQYMWNRFPNSPFDEAAALIREEWRAGDVVIHLSKLSALPTIYYARELTQRYVTDAPGSPEDTLALPTQQALGLLADACIQSAARDAGRVWLVTFADAARQAEAAGRDDVRRALDWLDANFALVQQRRFNDLDVSLYVARAGAARETDCPAETA